MPDDLVDAGVEVAGGSYLLEQMVRAYFDAGVLRVAEEEALEGGALPPRRRAAPADVVEQAISARINSLTPAERELSSVRRLMGGVLQLARMIALSAHRRESPGQGDTSSSREG
ncbi:MAG: hypothetical protein R3B99_21875 [Polyangiales bacterium]